MDMTNIIAENIRTLISGEEISPRQLALRSGLSERMGIKIASGQANLTSENILKIASAFNIYPWCLLIEGMTYAVMKDAKLKKVIDLYIASPKEIRKKIVLAIEKEIIFSKQVGQLHDFNLSDGQDKTQSS